MHQVDLLNVNLKRLTELADRIGKLFDKFQAKPSDPIVSALDDLLGALYALVSAVEKGFKGKTGFSEFEAASMRAKQLASGLVRKDGNWMAGFHFNSAMFRISATFDRLPKALAGSYTGADIAYSETQGKPWQKTAADKIREEVNTVKHKGGLWAGRNADIATTLSAVNELLELAEALT